MSNQLHNELRKEFQLERMILFSDAVFAIGITLLVLEIKIPDFHENVSDQALIRSLGHLIPKFIGFIISFFLIGIIFLRISQENAGLSSFATKSDLLGSPSSAQRFLNIITAVGILIYVGLAIQLNLANN